MKYTLLEMTQLLLASMDSDEVNSINDTVEAYDIALTIKSVYYDLATDLNLPEHSTLFELNASGDNAKPTLMTVPSNVTSLTKVRYNYQETGETYENYQTLTQMSLNDFIMMQNGLRGLTSNVGSMDVTVNGETFEFMYKTNAMPKYYTVLEDNTLIFDAYDSTEDTTLQKSKTMCEGVVYPTFTIDDAFTPDIDPTQFSLLINKAKQRLFVEKKQIENVEASSETRRQKIITQKRKRKVKGQNEVFNVLSRFGKP